MQSRDRLGDQGRGGGRGVAPGGLELLLLLVVASQAVDARLDQNQAVLGVLVLAVAVQVAADVDGLLDKAVQILGELRGNTAGLEDTEDLLAGDLGHLGDTLGVTQDDTDLRRGHALLGELQDVILDGGLVDLAPGRRGAAVRQRRARNTLALSVHATHLGCRHSAIANSAPRRNRPD
jgi:hypothetical protein